MVNIKRINAPIEDQEIDPNGERYKLVEVYVQDPTANPSEEAKVLARPYEFCGYTPVKYSTSCPHCGQGVWFEPSEIETAVDRLFISCPECGVGAPKITPLIDPFINPVGEKIAEATIDPDLISAHDTIEPAAGSVAVRLSEEALAELNSEHIVRADYMPVSDQEACRPDNTELIKILDDIDG